MRTTINIDQDVLQAAKELATAQNKSVGAVISELIRKALTAKPSDTIETIQEPRANYGFKPFPARAIVSNRDVDRLRDEEGI